MNHGVIIQFIR